MGLGHKVKNPVSLMPASLIQPELYHDSFIAAEDGCEHAKKSIGISPVLLHDSVPTAQRVYPTKDIESFMMLTPRHYKGLSSLLSPHPAKLGMKAKSRFIREQQHPSSVASFDGQVRKYLSQLTLAEKVGQMTQADQSYLHDLDDLQKYHLGSLLSGGEQALTALSLIFAVFRCNPAPVCVLDEVDAPLDDANIGRFTRLLEEFKSFALKREYELTEVRARDLVFLPTEARSAVG